MIARLWKGWTTLENADAYESLLRETVLPGLQHINGYRGGYIMRQDGNEEVEFAVLNLFESLEAVKTFAGPDYTVPVFEPEARRLLAKVEPIARHYEVKSAP
ncbi:antibiotic biosynthesis monooxygenase [Ktedonosporobacter rubrisoli]|uniref:Antibiotic biosynthesis monooxygenase n=1 Tax=Ktedonosporobacter rubrisoli TaxID=2509675 RepID=A0A4P6JJ78_KTERU|nr:antibiotic biosynthesis monooxygenase [Ktedonosporobacter rubrisoli]QBD74972.1 antibiotic biosynthesis monooxygenase [Ktedonosporobacter rubrisoli]